MKLTLKFNGSLKNVTKKHVKFLRRIVTTLDVIATTLLEVETLDAKQIRHLADHGTLPDRSKGYENQLMLLLKISR